MTLSHHLKATSLIKNHCYSVWPITRNPGAVRVCSHLVAKYSATLSNFATRMTTTCSFPRMRRLRRIACPVLLNGINNVFYSKMSIDSQNVFLLLMSLALPLRLHKMLINWYMPSCGTVSMSHNNNKDRQKFSVKHRPGVKCRL